MHSQDEGSTRRSEPVVRATLVALGLVALGCTYEPARTPRARDVVVIVVEALRADRVSALAGERERPAHEMSPHIDALADDGVVYARATAPATWCVPGYGSLLTGRWPSFHGAERLGDGERAHARGLDADASTLGEVLGDAGYSTAVFAGSSSALAGARGLARGFSTFEVVGDGGGEMRSAVAAWLAGHPEPSLMLVGIGGLDAPETDAPTDLAAAYDRAVVAADRTVGEVLAALRASGRYEEALVVVTADHGKLLGEHGLSLAGRPPFEPQVHVPLIVKHAGDRRAGETVPRRVSTLGLFATVLESTGISPRGAIQSKPFDDLHPVWVEEVDAAGARMRAGYDGPDVKIISLAGRHDTAACFFDLAADPGEHRPHCEADAAPVLRAALASFARRSRPARVPASVAAAPDPIDGPGAARAAN